MIYKAKKALGQNFLKSVLALQQIIKAGEITKNDTILEIGPGKGVLTEKLLENAGKVIAIEKDNDLFEFLQVKFNKEIVKNRLILVKDDILEFNTPKSSKPFEYKVIANIPYNITGAILKKFLTETVQPSLMVLLVQREVAQRVVARDKKESILSISVKAYGKPSIIAKVPARYFSPAPKVDSAIIKISDISRKFFTENDINEEIFWEIVKKGFAHKRKKLSGNLKSILKVTKNTINDLGEKRAENLSLSDWASLTK